jgi:hypothetical protein
LYAKKPTTIPMPNWKISFSHASKPCRPVPRRCAVSFNQSSNPPSTLSQTSTAIPSCTCVCRMSASSSVAIRIAPQIRTPPMVGVFALLAACARRASASVEPASPILRALSLRMTGLPPRRTIKKARNAAMKARNSVWSKTRSSR